MYERLYPIGSVVLLKGGNKRLMVVGRIQTCVGDTTIYDYAGCLYPEGMTSSNLSFFMHDDIERVYFIGFQDPEELAFRAQVLAPINELYVNEDGEIVDRGPAEDDAE